MKTGIIGDLLQKYGYTEKETQDKVLLKYTMSQFTVARDGADLLNWVIKCGIHDPQNPKSITDSDRLNQFEKFLGSNPGLEDYINKWK